MSIFDKLMAMITSFNGDEDQLLEAHKLLWETGMSFSGQQFYDAVQGLKALNPESSRSKCWSMLSEGALYTFFPSYGNAFEKLSAAAEAFGLINEKGGEGAAQCLLVIYFKNAGQLDKAQECVQNSILNIGENKTYLQFLCITYYQAGELNHMIKDHAAAIQYFTKGLQYAKAEAAVKTRLLIGLACVYKDSDELDKAFDFFQEALKQIEGKGINILESKIYADLGNYYYRKKDFANAISFHEKSIRVREKHSMKNPLITNYIELAEIYLEQNKKEEALNYISVAEQLSKELNIIIKLCQVYLIISKIHESLGNTSLALEYYKKYHLTKEEVFSQESARQLKQLSMRHEMETVQQETELFKLKNVVLKSALDEIEASVRYAQRIQEAILPPTELLKEKFPASFLLYKPKDVVAGDFYWMEQIGNTVLIAAADCTGHGVPGAMVSVVCSNALNRAVKEFHLSDPGAILDKVTDLVLETFEKSVAEVKDGMDISLLSIEYRDVSSKSDDVRKEKPVIKWSGANNPLWYFSNNKQEEITADKQPIGKSDHRKPFKTHVIEHIPGTTFFLFTDGYADQFGGPKGKKFKYKQLQETLFTILDKTPPEQQYALDNTFESWKGELEQVDDVCVIGIRV